MDVSKLQLSESSRVKATGTLTLVHMRRFRIIPRNQSYLLVELLLRRQDSLHSCHTRRIAGGGIEGVSLSLDEIPLILNELVTHSRK